MKFKYKRFGKTLRPVIPIKVKHAGTEIGYDVLVDSGADLCLFDAEIGEAIGIDVKRGKKGEIFGVGGKASLYFLHKVDIEVGGWTYSINAGFMPSVGNHFMSYGIVGQRGFFDIFITKFDLLKEQIELKSR